jgi:hypothetical protein
MPIKTDRKVPWPSHGSSVSSSTVSRTSAFCALLQKWLKVGFVEDGRRIHGVCGAPPGAVKIYLHYYVFDLWIHRRRLTKASGDWIVVRCADDTIVGFQHEQRTMLQQTKKAPENRGL